MSGRMPEVPNQSVPELKEENSSETISWSEDEKFINLYSKYNEEEGNIEEFLESALVEISRVKNEKLDMGNIDNEFNNDVEILLKFDAIKKETNTENAAAEELTYDNPSLFLPETIKQEEIHIKSEDDEKQKLNKKRRKAQNRKVLHQCPECPYSTNHKGNLKQHSVRHKKRNEIDWFSCQECPYKTPRKERLVRHAEIHSSLMLKCSKCCYETSRQANLINHQKKHKTKYKLHSCPLCSYKTRNKPSLKIHCRRSHSCDPKNLKQIEIFKCPECPYENGYMRDVKLHQLTHDQSSWIQCPECVYKTPRKANLKIHQLRHQGENGEGWHRCSECSYKTTHKNALQHHVISHKTADEIQWFECSRCSFKTPYKYYLKQHQLKHKEPHEIEWFCCYECAFKTKHKTSLARHLSAHKEKGTST